MTSPEKLDPLYLIFKKKFKDDVEQDLDLFISSVIGEYLTHLEEAKIFIPDHRKPNVVQQMADEVEDMIRKTFMGCLNPDDYSTLGKIKKLPYSPREKSDVKPEDVEPILDISDIEKENP